MTTSAPHTTTTTIATTIRRSMKHEQTSGYLHARQRGTGYSAFECMAFARHVVARLALALLGVVFVVVVVVFAVVVLVVVEVVGVVVVVV